MVQLADKPMIIYFVFKDAEVVYIGQTKQGLKTRRTGHLVAARNGKGSVMGAALRKHGEDKFEWKKHSIYYNQADLDAAEKHYIAKYKPRYNVQTGGLNNKPKTLNRAPISQKAWNKGRKETRPEVLQRISEAAKDRTRTKRGSYSPKHVEAIRTGRLDKLRETAVPFICHQNGKTYWAKVDAAEELGIDVRGITAVLCPTHRMKSYKGFTFSYVD